MRPIVIKPDDIRAFITVLAALCTATGVIGAFIEKIVHQIRGPNLKQNEVLQNHEKRLAEHDEELKRLRENMQAVEENHDQALASERAMQKVILALVDYQLEGTDGAREKLEAARDDFRTYFLNK